MAIGRLARDVRRGWGRRLDGVGKYNRRTGERLRFFRSGERNYIGYFLLKRCVGDIGNGRTETNAFIFDHEWTTNLRELDAFAEKTVKIHLSMAEMVTRRGTALNSYRAENILHGDSHMKRIPLRIDE